MQGNHLRIARPQSHTPAFYPVLVDVASIPFIGLLYSGSLVQSPTNFTGLFPILQYLHAGIRSRPHFGYLLPRGYLIGHQQARQLGLNGPPYARRLTQSMTGGAFSTDPWPNHDPILPRSRSQPTKRPNLCCITTTHGDQ